MRTMRMLLTGAMTVLLALPALAECTCKTARVEGGWCGDCNKGYVAGITVASRKLYDALQGKPVNEADIRCPGCRKAMAAGGTCDSCRISYSGKQAFRSPFAAALAAGQRVKSEEITCPTCRGNADQHGWCDSCKAGIVHHRVFKEREAYDRAVKAWEILAASTKELGHCEQCAIAMATNGRCEQCKESFQDGKPIKP